MKWSNAIENRVLTVINLAVFAAVVWLLVLPGYNARIESLERQNKAKDETIVELSKIARYAITNQYDKIKAKDGTVTLDLNNSMNVENENPEQTPRDSSDIEKRTFWDKLFGRD